MSSQVTVRKSELASLISSISGGGGRSIVITGEEGIGKSFLLSKLGNAIPKLSDWNIWTEVDGGAIQTPIDFCSTMVRNLVAGDAVSADSLNLLAREFGKFSIVLDRKKSRVDGDFDFGNELANALVQLLESRLGAIHAQLNRFVPILSIDNIHLASNNLIEWFVGPFNQAIRESSLFKNSRFLFSAEDYSQRLQSIFDRFGFEQVRRLNLHRLNINQCADLNRQTYKKNITPKMLFEESKGNPSKLLNFLKNYTTHNKEDITLESQTHSSKQPSLSEFSEKEIERLSYAAYPERINRYNLEFFTTTRDAAFCYNWLKRNPRICTVLEDGDLVLNQNIRDAVFSHCEFEDSELHEKNKIKSTILSAYIGLFPDPDTHWIPVNLQIFDSFNNGLIKHIFDPFQADAILEFIDDHSEQFIHNNSQTSLSDDASLITRRFIEIGGAQPIDGLAEKAALQWELDLEAIRKKKLKLEQEKVNIGEEVAGIEKQITHFSGLKDQITNAMNKPRASNKARKELTFSVSKSLVVVGLVTIALSLISTLFGTYHAAVGIALTLFGFFWPSVQVRRANVTDQGLNPKLALETQQHSVEHRINGLASRVSTLNNSLISISDTLAENEEDSLIPYVSTKQESEG